MHVEDCEVICNKHSDASKYDERGFTMTVSEKTKLTVPFVDFKQRYALYRNEILPAVDEVFSSGNYILGPYVEELEKLLSKYLNCPYVLGINDGTTALILALKVLNVGLGDEVIVPVNSFVASAGAVVAAETGAAMPVKRVSAPRARIAELGIVLP